MDHLLTFPVLSIAASGPKKPEFFPSLVSVLLHLAFNISDLSKLTVLLDNIGLHEYDLFLFSNAKPLEENDTLEFIDDSEANFHDLAPEYMTARLLFNTPMII